MARPVRYTVAAQVESPDPVWPDITETDQPADPRLPIALHQDIEPVYGYPVHGFRLALHLEPNRPIRLVRVVGPDVLILKVHEHDVVDEGTVVATAVGSAEPPPLFIVHP